jgi:calcineurin-like phosphoesterase family protein
MKTLNCKQPIILLGDIHGDWNHLLFNMTKKNIENAYIISVGDLGIGFNPGYEARIFSEINSFFKNRNINFYATRGNHDGPKYFKAENQIKLSNFELLEDYTIMEYDGKSIQFIGGAISIDRTGRQNGVSYWDDEGVVFDKEKLQKVDILVTHTAPSWCFPQHFNEMVYGWAREDAYLIQDLNNERAMMDEIFKVCQPSFHFYGHFHSSWTEEIAGCRHKLLDINELFQYNPIYEN